MNRQENAANRSNCNHIQTIRTVCAHWAACKIVEVQEWTNSTYFGVIKSRELWTPQLSWNQLLNNTCDFSDLATLKKMADWLTLLWTLSITSAQRLRIFRRLMRESRSAWSRKVWSFSTWNFDRLMGKRPSMQTQVWATHELVSWVLIQGVKKMGRL